jgi:asparagine synthase (glutamine-hydrolysing)
MPDNRYDESHFAEQVAAHLGTDHTTVPCEPRPVDDLRTLIEQTGIPLGDSSLLPTFWVSKAARSVTSVALGGDGGDELFVGYERYEAAALLERAGCLFSLIPRWLLRTRNSKSWQSRLERLQHAGVHGYLDLVAIFRWMELGRLNASWGPQPGFRYRLQTVQGREQAVDWDLKNYLPRDILPKADMASMSVALELRSPMLDRELSTLARSATIRSLIPNDQRKGLLRQVARRYLPAEIVDRPKMGFAIPIGEWFRSDYGGLRTMLLDHLNSTEPFGPPSLGIDLNMKFIRQMLDEHLGTGPSGRVVRDHSQRLYMLLVLSIWAKWLGGLGKSA